MIGGMSDETIPENDPPPKHSWHRTAEQYCYDNGHSTGVGDDMCYVCGVTVPKNSPVGSCEACGQTYVKSHLGDHGICRLCEVREDGIRNMIADEIRIIMDDYTNTVMERIRNRGM